MSNPFDIGGLGGLGGMMASFQKQMQDVQAEAEAANFEASSGGGLVTVVVTGKMQVVSISIAEEAFEEKEMLEDLIIAAINNGLKNAQNNMQEKMGALTAGLPIPPGMLGF
jgi:nucleoid-associated protein EbfC